jgi:uncharacterized protein YbaP (TraB family)
MFSRGLLLVFVTAITLAGSSAASAQTHSCVWKVIAPTGGTLYLGGSVHALRSTDYPLPPAYNRAFDAADRIVFEADPNISPWSQKRFAKTAEYPKNDSLKQHLDPRTYDYLRRLFANWRVPEEKVSRLKPWAMLEVLWTPALYGFSESLGLESYLERRAHANHKPISGLESFSEHNEVLSNLSDRQAEVAILLTLIPETDPGTGDRVITAWRKGDADTIAQLDHAHFRDFPAFEERLVDDRSRKWIPKIESYLQSGHVYFVVAGVGHMGGPDGVLALLRARDYRVEQL